MDDIDAVIKQLQSCNDNYLPSDLVSLADSNRIANSKIHDRPLFTTSFAVSTKSIPSAPPPSAPSSTTSAHPSTSTSASTPPSAFHIYNTIKRQKGKKTTYIIGDYQLGDELGKGSIGQVYKGINVKTGAFVAVKRANRHEREASLEKLMKDVTYFKGFEHENIVKYLDLVATSNTYNLVFEYVESGSLSSLLNGFELLTEPTVSGYMEQILEALAYLHKMQIIHRDVKGSNLLITKDSVVKLADFGFTFKETFGSEEDRSGTFFWSAPEVRTKSKSLTPACDIWSLGSTIIELLTGSHPYSSLGDEAVTAIGRNQPPPFPASISSDLQNFLQNCFKTNPAERATAEQLLKHSWITTHKKGDNRRARKRTQGSTTSAVPDVAKAQEGAIQDLGRELVVSFLVKSIESTFVNTIPSACFVLLKFIDHFSESPHLRKIYSQITSNFYEFINEHRHETGVLTLCLSGLSLVLHLTGKKLSLSQEKLDVSVLDPDRFLTSPIVAAPQDSSPHRSFYSDLRTLVSTLYGLLLGNIFKNLRPLLTRAVKLSSFSSPGFTSSNSFSNFSMMSTNSSASVPSAQAHRVTHANTEAKIVPPMGRLGHQASQSQMPVGPSAVEAIVSFFEDVLAQFQNNFLFPSTSKSLFQHSFALVDTSLFNHILSKRELCTKDAANEIQSHIIDKLHHAAEFLGEEWVGNAAAQMKLTRQATKLLASPSKSDGNVNLASLCPDLRKSQIKHLLLRYQNGPTEKRVQVAHLSNNLSVHDGEFGLFADASSIYGCLEVACLHYLSWNDLQTIGLPSVTQKQLMSRWYLFSTQCVQEKMNQQVSKDWPQLLLSASEYASAEIQKIIGAESTPSRKK
eukprot:TRINITY_DN4644_c0_g1_i1.p1 TRINITY_DN4644_c0_g1~~TRINITY_DN4644_c0_g1_i1.p1  ORF type:complete len:855 (+),score=176.61 TRINITY_DN4644_c0_g1_i1:51-2615(+)